MAQDAYDKWAEIGRRQYRGSPSDRELAICRRLLAKGAQTVTDLEISWKGSTGVNPGRLRVYVALVELRNRGEVESILCGVTTANVLKQTPFWRFVETPAVETDSAKTTAVDPAPAPAPAADFAPIPAAGMGAKVSKAAKRMEERIAATVELVQAHVKLTGCPALISDLGEHFSFGETTLRKVLRAAVEAKRLVRTKMTGRDGTGRTPHGYAPADPATSIEAVSAAA